MTTPSEDAGYSALQRRVLALTGINLDAYKRQQMLRRLDAIVNRCHVRDLNQLASELRPGSAVLKEFMERFTINVSECFRDKPRFDQLAKDLLPQILKRNPAPHLWSAGCSYGAEPYSLAMLLRELNAPRGTVLATDIDPKILEAARAGTSFTAHDLQNLPRALAQRYFTPFGPGEGGEERFKVADSLKSLVTFRQHNLLTAAPGHHFDLILCRNVTIYFTEAAKDGVTAMLAGSLRPGGVLFIGETETLHHPIRFGLTLRSSSFYERVA